MFFALSRQEKRYLGILCSSKNFVSIQLNFTGGQAQCGITNCPGGQHYAGNYVCSNDVTNWNQGMISFQDPVPVSNVLVVRKILIQFTGNFAPNAPKLLIQLDAQEYVYGGVNNFQIIGTNLNPLMPLCLSTMAITIFYGPTTFRVISLEPSMGPSQGNTTVNVIGSGFVDKPTTCLFGTVTTPGKRVNATLIVCVSPQLDQDLPKGFYNVTVQIIYFVVQRIQAKRAAGILPAPTIPADGTSPMFFSADYKTLFEIKPIEMTEIVIQNRIGRGSCAEVFTGTWRGITVAIKKAKLLSDDDEEFLTELAQEAAIMSQLRHPNICQFLGTCNNPPEVLIVMEYMSRGSLYRILHDATITIDWPRMKSIALDIAKGMTTMTPVGTPCWTAPEVLRNDQYTEKADVFSFAIVLWELVTREDPYQGMPTFQIVISVGQHKLRPIVPPHVSAPFTRLITECWSEDPTQRPSFQEIVKRLESM
eukprot:gene13424-15818_t